MKKLLAHAEADAPLGAAPTTSEKERIVAKAVQTHRQCRRALAAFPLQSMCAEATASGLIVSCCEAFHRLLTLQVTTVDGHDVYEYGKGDYPLYSNAWLAVAKHELQSVSAKSGKVRLTSLETAKRVLDLLQNLYVRMQVPVDETRLAGLQQRLSDEELFS